MFERRSAPIFPTTNAQTTSILTPQIGYRYNIINDFRGCGMNLVQHLIVSN